MWEFTLVSFIPFTYFWERVFLILPEEDVGVTLWAVWLSTVPYRSSSPGESLCLLEIVATCLIGQRKDPKQLGRLFRTTYHTITYIYHTKYYYYSISAHLNYLSYLYYYLYVFKPILLCILLVLLLLFIRQMLLLVSFHTNATIYQTTVVLILLLILKILIRYHSNTTMIHTCATFTYTITYKESFRYYYALYTYYFC